MSCIADLMNDLNDARVGLLEVWEIGFIVWLWRLCDFIEIIAKFELIVINIQQRRFMGQIEIMVSWDYVKIMISLG